MGGVRGSRIMMGMVGVLVLLTVVVFPMFLESMGSRRGFLSNKTTGTSDFCKVKNSSIMSVSLRPLDSPLEEIHRELPLPDKSTEVPGNPMDSEAYTECVKRTKVTSFAYFRTHHQTLYGAHQDGDGEILKVYSHISPMPHKKFMDVGANKGMFALNFFHYWGGVEVLKHVLLFDKCVDKDTFSAGNHPGPRVWAVEPNPLNAAFLRVQSEKIYQGNLKVVEAAASDVPSVAPFTFTGIIGDEQGSLSGATQFVNESGATKSVEVRITTVDELMGAENINTVDFLKIDTEGSEKEVFYGMFEAVKKKRLKFISFEFGYKWCNAERAESARKVADLGEVVEFFDRWGYDSFFQSVGNLNQINGLYWDRRYELCHNRTYSAWHNILVVDKAAPERNELLKRFNNEVEPCLR